MDWNTLQDLLGFFNLLRIRLGGKSIPTIEWSRYGVSVEVNTAYSSKSGNGLLVHQVLDAAHTRHLKLEVCVDLLHCEVIGVCVDLLHCEVIEVCVDLLHCEVIEVCVDLLHCEVIALQVATLGSKNLDFHLADHRQRTVNQSYAMRKPRGDKVYLSSTSSTMILDDAEIHAIKALKNANSGVELKNPYMSIDFTRLVKGTVENLLM
ncbi:hypothetical protein Tco_1194424 [Tanacetum coccineum]